MTQPARPFHPSPPRILSHFRANLCTPPSCLKLNQFTFGDDTHSFKFHASVAKSSGASYLQLMSPVQSLRRVRTLTRCDARESRFSTAEPLCVIVNSVAIRCPIILAPAAARTAFRGLSDTSSHRSRSRVLDDPGWRWRFMEAARRRNMFVSTRTFIRALHK